MGVPKEVAMARANGQTIQDCTGAVTTHSIDNTIAQCTMCNALFAVHEFCYLFCNLHAKPNGQSLTFLKCLII